MTTDVGPLGRSGDAGDRSVGRARILEALTRADALGTGVGVVHIDLDRFHRVNSRFGQEAGDEVLRTLLARLEVGLPGGALIVAGDGDGFVVALPGGGPASTRELAAGLLEAIRRPVLVGAQTVTVQGSAGIAWRTPGDCPVDLVEHAFLACRRAKATAPGTVVGYEVALAAEAERRQRIDEELRRAIAHDELVLHVQPEVRGADGAVIGVEALVRWQHPTDGLLPPAAFLPDAEATGLMVEVGDWVLDHAMLLAARWATLRDGAPVRVWVNLAAQQLDDGDRLCRRVRRALDEGLICPESIGFEVTESSLLQDLQAAVDVLMTLRGMGFEIALDDFGTGYSSLTYLRQLPVTVVKIDRQFVAGIRTGSLADEAIVEAVVDLSHALGLAVVAEGVEDTQQAARLLALGADSFQGFHFSRPAPPDEIDRLLTLPWCGVAAPSTEDAPEGRVADRQPRVPNPAQHPSNGQLVAPGSARSRLLLAALDAARDSIIVTAAAAPAPGTDQRIGDQRIVYVNPAFTAETGYAAPEVIGRSVEVLFHEPAAPELVAWFSALGSDGASATIEVPNRRADGTVYLCETTVSPISDERGFRTNWLHVRRDLTQRRAAEGDRARFQGLMEQTKLMVFLAETGGQWVYVNEAMRRVLGLPLDNSVEGLSTQETLPPDVLAHIAAEAIPALYTTGSWSGELQLTHAETGELMHVETDVQMFADPLRPGTSVFATVGRDVTDVKRLERASARRRELDAFATDLGRRALRQKADEFRAELPQRLRELGALLAADLVHLDEIDAAAGVLTPLRSWCGGQPAEATSADAHEPTHVPLEHLTRWLAQLASTDVVLTWDALRGAAGSESDLLWRSEIADVVPSQLGGREAYAPLRVDGELIGVLGLAARAPEPAWSEDDLATLQAVADTLANQLVRSRSAATLSASEARAAAMLANVSDVLVVIDRGGWIRYVNPAVVTRFERAVEEVIGQHFLDLVHPEDRQLALERFVQTVDAEEPLPVTELRVLRADGSSVWCDVETSGVFDPLVGGFMVSLRDVTQQRASLESSERLAAHQQFVVSISRWAIEVESEDLLDGLHDHLERLGRMLGADSAFAALIEGDRCRNVAGWSITESSEDYAFPAGDLEVPAVVARYRTLEPLVVSDIYEHDEDWAVAWRAFPVPDRSGLNVPLVSEGRCLGNLGVAMISEPREWTDEEVELVRRVSEVVSTLLARLQIEAELRRSQARSAALLDGSHDLVVGVDRDGVITYANRAVEHRLHYPMDDVIGMHVDRIVHPDDLRAARRGLEELSVGARSDNVVLRLRAADGSFGWWEVTTGRQRHPSAGGRVFTCRDVTARVAADAKAAAWMELLGYAFELAQVALDLDSRAFIAQLPQVCTRLAQLLEVDVVYLDRVDEIRRTLTSMAGWDSRSGLWQLTSGNSLSFDELPEWIERLRDPQPVVMHRTATSVEPWALAKRRILGGSTAEMAVAMSAAGELFGVLGVSMHGIERVWTDDEITFVRIVGETIAHVLERARLDDALRASESRFRLLSENAADVVVLLDSRGRITYASPSSKELLGYTPSDLLGRDARSLTHPDDAADTAHQLERLLASGVNTSEMRLVRADGSVVWVANSTSTVNEPEIGGAVEYRISLRDISDRKRLEQQLEWQALHDPLTGLANRILLRRQLDLAVARRGRPNDVTVLLVDLDGFKAVNDTYGHALGDEVLRALAARFDALTRPTDTLARTGGDEFVLLCPETDADGGVALGNRIIEAARTPIHLGDATVSLGASVGVAHRGDGGADPDALLIDADHAMYQAKRSGRCRVCVAAPPSTAA